MRRKAVITGAAGQDGSYLAELLLEKGYEVYGVVRPSPRDRRENLSECLDHPRFHLIEGDLLNKDLAVQLAQFTPDEFYHLGALSHVGKSFNHPTLVLETNTNTTARLLEALCMYSCKTRFYFAATSEMLPDGGKGSALGANSPYAASKVAAHLLTQMYRKAYSLFTVSGIAFNHESPRRPATFVTKKIVEGVRGFVNGGSKLQLGNISACRDWHHAKDTVQGMWLALQADQPDDYIFASGEAHSVMHFAEKVCAVYSTTLEEAVEYDVESNLRPLDVEFLLGDPSHAEEKLGWQRSYSFDELIKDMCR